MKHLLILIFFTSCACDGEIKPRSHNDYNGHKYLTFCVPKDHCVIHDPDCPCQNKEKP